MGKPALKLKKKICCVSRKIPNRIEIATLEFIDWDTKNIVVQTVNTRDLKENN